MFKILYLIFPLKDSFVQVLVIYKYTSKSVHKSINILKGK